MKKSNYSRASNCATSFIINNLKDMDLPLLNKDEEYELLDKAINEGDIEARDLLVQYNYRLVIKIANKYKGRNVDFEDLIQEGFFGLNRAIEKFDLDSNNKFSTYATWWIRHSVTRYLSNNSRTIRYPIKIVENLNKISTLKREIFAKYGREPNDEEYNSIGFSREKVIEMTEMLPRTNNLEYNTDDQSTDRPLNLIENIPDNVNISDEILYNEQVETLRLNIELLNENEQYIIKSLFGIDMPKKTKSEIVKELGYSNVVSLNAVYHQAMLKLKSELQGLL